MGTSFVPEVNSTVLIMLLCKRASKRSNIDGIEFELLL